MWFTAANKFKCLKCRQPTMELMVPNIFLSDPSEQEIGRENPEVSEKGGNIMITMWEKLFTFKRVVKDQLVQLVQYFRGSNSERTRVYQVWPGKNVSLFTMWHLNLVVKLVAHFFFLGFVLKLFTYYFIYRYFSSMGDSFVVQIQEGWFWQHFLLFSQVGFLPSMLGVIYQVILDS